MKLFIIFSRLDSSFILYFKLNGYTAHKYLKKKMDQNEITMLMEVKLDTRERKFELFHLRVS